MFVLARVIEKVKIYELLNCTIKSRITILEYIALFGMNTVFSFSKEKKVLVQM